MNVFQSYRAEGTAAQKAGKAVTDNPYPVNSRAHGQWLQGFIASKMAG